MGVTAFTKGYKMDAQNDVLDQATCGHRNHTGRYICRVTGITAITDATGGVVDVSTHGTTGPIIFHVTMATEDTVTLVFSTPQDLADIALPTVVPLNAYVLVHLA